MQRGFVGIILLVVLVAAVAAGGYFLGTQRGGLPTIFQSPMLSPTPLSSEVLTKEGDPTTNWKTYTNTERKFTFRYPGSLSLRSDSTDEFTGFLDKSNKNYHYQLVLIANENPQNFDLEVFAEKNKPVPDDRTNVSYGKTQINNYDALLERSELPCLGICEGIKTGKAYKVFIKGEKIVVSFLIDTNKPGGTTAVDELWIHQILSTLKFTD